MAGGARGQFRGITPHPALYYAYQRTRDALLALWDTNELSGWEDDADDREPSEG